jgi:hypothetical protein
MESRRKSAPNFGVKLKPKPNPTRTTLDLGVLPPRSYAR